MHFLKCNNCGFLNEFKSEYQTFCQKCNKKLDNNFRDWQQRNPEKTIQNFKDLMCVSDIEINNIPVVVKSRPKSLKYWIGFSITFIALALIGQFVGNKAGDLFRFGRTPKSILEQKWISEKYGEDGLIVETPFKLTPIELPIPEKAKAYLDNCSSYMTETTKSFIIAINSFRYKPEVGTINLQGAANNSIAEVKMQPGITDFDYKEDYIFKGDVPGFSQKGTFIKDKVKMEFINVGFGKLLVLYHVMVGYRTDDKVAREVAQRIINSIKIEKDKSKL